MTSFQPYPQSLNRLALNLNFAPLVQHANPPPTSPHKLKMIIRKSILRPLAQLSGQTRHIHSSTTKSLRVPRPTPFIPDVTSFLTVIGRGLSAHASKFDSWNSLFTLTSEQMKAKGIEPPRARRYLLRWREKFSLGFYGVGGDLKHVKDGVAELRVVEVPHPLDPENPVERIATVTRPRNTDKVVVNVPAGMPSEELSLEDLHMAEGFRVCRVHSVAGPHVEPLKGTQGWGAVLKVKEGLWEDKRGHKVDGGERRRAEVRAKRRAEENKKSR